MFAIAFDSVVADTEEHHPKGVTQAYADIGSTLGNFGFERIQGSVYVSQSEDLAQLFRARAVCATSAHFASSNGPPSWPPSSSNEAAQLVLPAAEGCGGRR